MKVKIEIECTPEEARTFLGMVDLSDAQEAFAKGLRERVATAVETLDPETLMKAWMPEGLKGLEELQKAFWQGMGGKSGSTGT